MSRAFTPTLALFLAAGIGVVGPVLVAPDPVDIPWTATGAATADDHTGPEPMARGVVANLTAVRPSGLPNSRPARPAELRLVATTGERTDETSDPVPAADRRRPGPTDHLEPTDHPDERTASCHTN